MLFSMTVETIFSYSSNSAFSTGGLPKFPHAERPNAAAAASRAASANSNIFLFIFILLTLFLYAFLCIKICYFVLITV